MISRNRFDKWNFVIAGALLLLSVRSSAVVPRFAYVANSKDNTVSIYTVDAVSGQLRDDGYALSGKAPSGVVVTASGKFVYVANSGSNNVSAFKANTTNGALTPVSGSPFLAHTNPVAIAVDPAGKFVFVANKGSGDISAYTINATTGALTVVSGSPFLAGTSPVALTVDPSGKFLYVADSGPDEISGFSIGSTGALTALANSPFPAGTSPVAIRVSPSGKFVYVANNGSNNVSGYKLDTTTGALTPIMGSPFAAGTKPSAITLDPTTKFAYVANSGSNDVSEYIINSTTGQLSSVSGSPVGAGTAPAALTVDPSGKFVFVGNKNSNDISSFRLSSSAGSLTALVPGPHRARKGPGALVVSAGSSAITYSPRFAYVANFETGTTAVPAFSVVPRTGALTMIAGSPFGSGSPQSLAASPNGTFLYTANDDGSNTVGEFRVNSTTGDLTSVGTILGGSGSTFVTVDPSNRFVYQVGGNTDGVFAYKINQATGALTKIAGSPFTSEISAPFGVAVDPTGRFLLVVDSTTCPTCTPQGITVFTIDPGSGALTLVAGSPFPPPTGVFSLTGITVDPTGRFAYLVNNAGTCCVSSYSINSNSGALTSVGTTLPAGLNPEHVAADVAGQYVYTTGNDTNVFGYAIDNTTGALTALAHSPFTCPACATQGLRADPSGKFLYVADRFHITGYSINASTGALTELPTSPYPTGTGSDPFDVAIVGTVK